MVGGWVAPGFEPVREEFERNLAERGELGAACAAYRRGEKVVDLWGGVRDARSGEPWEEDTLVVVFSTSKGLSAMTLALLHSRGHLDYDERVATYWPEFAAAGKQDVTVRQLIGHEAGLPIVDEPLDPAILADFDRLAAAIARQPPLWRPGTRHGYHGVSLGWYEGELVRRADPQGRTLGRFFAEEIAAPLGLDIFFGVPDTVEPRRIARIERSSPLHALTRLHHMPAPMLAAMANPRSVSFRTFANPRFRRPADVDRKEYRTLEFPAGGAVGGARDVARAYAAFAAREPELGLSSGDARRDRRAAADAAAGLARRGPAGGHRLLAGLRPPHGPFRFGASARSFGHPGAGGSFAFADPDREVSFAYVMNRMDFYLNDDPREKALRDAVYRCL